MKIPEFFHHLEYFTPEDYTQFEKFLKSPYFNTIKSYWNIFSLIKKHRKFIAEKKYDKMKAMLIKETGYSEKTVSKNFSHLTDMYIKYTKIETFRNEKLKSEIEHGTYLLSKGNLGLLNKRTYIIEKMLSNRYYFDQDIFFDVYNFYKLKYDESYFSEDKFDPLAKLAKSKEYTLESSSNLIVYTLASLTINLVNYSFQCDGDYKEQSKYTFNLEKMFEIIKMPEFKTYNNLQKTTITLFYKIYILFSDIKNNNLYKDYKNYFSKVKQMYNDEFRVTHINILMNYSFMRSRVHDSDKFFFNESFILLYEFIDGMYYKTEKGEYLHPTIYRNYVINCISRGRKNILKKFIDKQTEKLNPSDRNNMKNFALAHNCFLNNQFDAALNYIEKLNNPKFFYKIDIQILKVKLYYAKKDFVKLETIVHTLKEFLQKNTLTVLQEKEKYRNMIEFLELLVKENNRYQKTNKIIDFEMLLKKIDNKPSFIMRNWITEKIRQVVEEHYKNI